MINRHGVQTPRKQSDGNSYAFTGSTGGSMNKRLAGRATSWRAPPHGHPGRSVRRLARRASPNRTAHHDHKGAQACNLSPDPDGSLTGTAITAVILAVVPAIASASVPHSSTGTIHACYAVSNGALRVIDTEAGQVCQSTERPLSWPSAGVTATQYETRSSVNLPLNGSGIIVLPGPVLPAGTWNATMGAILINHNAQANTVRCGLYNGADGLLRGDAVSMPGPSCESVSLPTLITLFTPDRINVMCFHDIPLQSGGQVQVYYTNVVAIRVTARF